MTDAEAIELIQKSGKSSFQLAKKWLELGTALSVYSDKTDPVVTQVVKKLQSRSQAGIKKYGTTLANNNLTRLQWLTHAQEESLDLANYLQVLIIEESK